jgi:hypothetical protein
MRLPTSAPQIPGRQRQTRRVRLRTPECGLSTTLLMARQRRSERGTSSRLMVKHSSRRSSSDLAAIRRLVLQPRRDLPELGHAFFLAQLPGRPQQRTGLALLIARQVDGDPALLDPFHHRQQRLAVADQKIGELPSAPLPLFIYRVVRFTAVLLLKVLPPRFYSESEGTAASTSHYARDTVGTPAFGDMEFKHVYSASLLRARIDRSQCAAPGEVMVPW